LAPDALASLLARTPVFAALPLYEPFGLAVLEAAQAGCALVLSDIPSLRELWDGAALFVDPRAPDEAAAAIEGLLADDEHLAEMAAAAVRRAERYSAQALTAGTLAVYAAVMAAQRQEARA
jgi:glycosyltransferase involved in cell wall biosynthesis